MSAVSREAVAILACCLGACSDHPAPPTGDIAGFPGALAQLECGPADGPATSIYLSREASDTLGSAYPRVQVTVYAAPQGLPGQVITLDGSDRGSAFWCRGERDCVPADKAQVEFNAPMPHDTVRGWMDLTFPGLPAVRGRFAAPWRETSMLCG